MIHKLARYHVKREHVKDVLAATEAFVDMVARREGGTALYRALQDVADPTRFTHYMVFRTKAAEENHARSPWTKEFAAKVAPMCVEPPSVIDVVPLGPAA